MGLWLEVMVGVKVAIRILCAVALLVRCATCGMTREEDEALRAGFKTRVDVKLVENVLQSYIDESRVENVGRERHVNPHHLDTVKSHIWMLDEYNVFELNYDNITDKRLFIPISYCPATTMLACGEAEVSEEFCLELLHRANVFVQTSREYYYAVTAVDLDAKPEPSSLATSVWTPNSMPGSSLRQRRASTIEREQKVITEQQAVKQLLENRPPAELQKLVEERQKVLMIEKLTKDTSLEKHTQKLNKLTTEMSELTTEQQNLEREDKQAGEKLLQQELNARSRQVQRSIETSTALAYFPDEEPEKWLKYQDWTENFRDIARNCYPEQFIVCGRYVKSLAFHKKDTARKECYNTILKYYKFRQLARTSAPQRRSSSRNLLG